MLIWVCAEISIPTLTGKKRRHKHERPLVLQFPQNTSKHSNRLFKMMGGFTIARMAGMIGLMGEGGPTITKEDLLAINAKLNKIKKPDK